VMDAWCALWSWPLTTDIEPPDWEQWVGGLEAILGVPPRAGKFEKYGQTSIANELDWDELDTAESNDRVYSQALKIEEALRGFPWLNVAESVAKKQGFFHWELDFAPVFARGGFDLQVGNPPWVRPDWDEAGVLAELDPWWQLVEKTEESVIREKRATILADPAALVTFLDERAAQAGVTAHLGSGVDRPVLTGLRTDLYRCFMERTWRSMAAGGIIGLIHPDSHFTELRAKALRRETYRRLRRHWEFRNALHLFGEIDRHIHYAVHTYGNARTEPRWIQASSLFHPETVARSLVHDGAGDEPGLKDSDGNWNVHPHSHRIVEVAIQSPGLLTWVRSW